MAGVKGMKTGYGPKPGNGGARPNSGPMKAPPVLVEDLDSSDEEKFFESIMQNDSIDIGVRLNAAKKLADIRRRTKGGPLGKKDQLKADAKELGAGKFGTGAAPSVFGAPKKPTK